MSLLLANVKYLFCIMFKRILRDGGQQKEVGKTAGRLKF